MDCAVLGSTWAVDRRVMRAMEYLAQRNAAADTFLWGFFFSPAHADYWRKKKNIKAFVCFDFLFFFPLPVVCRRVIEAPLAGKRFETEAKLRRVGEA